MELLNLVSELLYQHNCVIIPDFGGFVANVKSTEFEPNRLLLSPTRKKVVFNQSLKDNDGLLINALVKRNGITYEQAEKQVYLFSKFLSDRIVDYKNYEFKNIGSFYLNKEDKLIFVAYEGLNFYKPSYGLQNIKVKRLNIAERIENPSISDSKPTIKQIPTAERRWLYNLTRIAGAAILISILGFSLQFLLGDAPRVKSVVQDVIKPDSKSPQSADFVPEISMNSEVAADGLKEAQSVVPAIEDVTENLRLDGKIPNLNTEEEAETSSSLSFEEINAQYQRASALESVYYVAVKQFTNQSEVQGLIIELQKNEYSTFSLPENQSTNHLCLEKFISKSSAMAYLALVKKYDYPKAYLITREE